MSYSLGAQTPSSVSLFSSPNPSTLSAAVSLTANLTPADATGKVTFYDGPAILGVAAVSGGQAVITVSLLSTGRRFLHAHYSGDSTHTGSDSTMVAHTVTSLPALSYRAPVMYSTDSMPTCLARADLNNDGASDLVTCDPVNGSLQIRLGHGHGRFGEAIAVPVVEQLAHIAVGDLNGDGIPDLVTASPNGIGILLGSAPVQSGLPAYAAPVWASQATGPVGISDFNGDGYADVIVFSASGIRVLLGKGDGTLTELAAGPQTGSIFVLGDFNNDGKIDAAVNDKQSASVGILLGNGDGTFRPGANYTTPAAAVSSADLDGDGILDLVVATSGGLVTILMGNGDGTFQQRGTAAAGVAPTFLAIADVDGDGRPDLIISGRGGVAILTGRGDGSFRSPVLHHLGNNPSFVAAADFNGTGGVDLAVLNPQSRSVAILLGQATPDPTLQVLSANPPTGSGTSQVFQIQFSDSAGAADIATMSVSFATTAGNQAHSCVVTYSRSSQAISLLDDAGVSPISLSGNSIAGTSLLQNSQCSVDAATSGPSAASGNTQSLSVRVGFKPAYSGTQNIYASVSNAGTLTTGWQKVGAWTVPSASTHLVESVQPFTGTGMNGTFAFLYYATNGNGPGDIFSVQGIIGNSTSLAGSCAFLVRPDSATIWLANDAGAWGGSSVVGKSGILQNSQCAVDTGASNLVWSGNAVAITLAISFSGSYAGTKKTYTEVLGTTGLDSGWIQSGTWTVAPATNPSYLISTILGQNLPPTSMAALSAVGLSPLALAIAPAGDVYFSSGPTVFRIDSGGQLTRVAGTGLLGFSGDGGPAINAEMSSIGGLALDSAGNLYISDNSNGRVRRVSSDGTITTFAGYGSYGGPSGNGGPATAALVFPEGLAVDSADNLYIADTGYSQIRKVDKNGTITAVAGTTVGFSGDGGLATAAQLARPLSIAFDSSGNLYIADQADNRIRKVSASGFISTVAGTHISGYSGDNGAAVSALLNQPSGVSTDASGNIYVADEGNSCIRKIDAEGNITTIAGGFGYQYNGDGIATDAALYFALSIASTPDGTLYVADTGNGRIRKISAGTISTIGGGGSGDAPRAALASFSPGLMATDTSGNLYLSDSVGNRVHKVTPSGSISTIAGTGVAGFSGDNGPATLAQLNQPSYLAVDSSGALYISDSGNSRVRKVSLVSGYKSNRIN